MAAKNKNAHKNKKSDIVFFKLSGMFFIAFFLIVFLTRLSGGTAAGNLGMKFWRLCQNPVYIGILGVLFALSLVFFIYNKFILKKDESLKYFSSVNALCVTSYALFASLFFARANNPVNPLLVTTSALIALYYIYNIYEKDFFIFSIINLTFCLSLWIFAIKTEPIYIILKTALVLVSIAVCIYLYNFASKRNQKIKDHEAKKGKKRFLRSFTVWPVFISSLIFAILLFSVLFYKLTTLQILLVMLIQFLFAGIFFTVKLIRET